MGDNGTVDETNIGGEDGALLCLECLDGPVIPSKVMVVHGAACRGVLLEVVLPGPCLGAQGLHQY